MNNSINYKLSRSLDLFKQNLFVPLKFTHLNRKKSTQKENEMINLLKKRKIRTTKFCENFDIYFILFFNHNSSKMNKFLKRA